MYEIETATGSYCLLPLMSPSVYNDGTTSAQVYPPRILYWYNKGPSKVMHCGFKPQNIVGRNSFGDTSVAHCNIKGKILANDPLNNGFTRVDLPGCRTSTRSYPSLTYYTSPTQGNLGPGWVDRDFQWDFVWSVKRDSAPAFEYYVYRYAAHVGAGSVRTEWINTDYITVNDKRDLYIKEIVIDVFEYLGGTSWRRKSYDQYYSQGSYPWVCLSDYVPLSAILTTNPWVSTITLESYTLATETTEKRSCIALRDSINGIANAHFSRFRRTLDAPWDRLAWTACSNMQAVSINSLSFVRDLITIGEEIKGLRNLLKGDVSKINLAKAWLSFRYGLRLTTKDLVSLSSGIWKRYHRHEYPLQIVRAMLTQDANIGPFSPGTVTFNYKVGYRYSDDVFLRCYASLFELDVAPTLENVWDLVPFSFVFDWILNIGDRLDYLDKLNYLSCIAVDAVTKSYTSSWFGGSGLGLPSGLSVRFYGRVAQPTLDDIYMPSLFPDSGRLINILDGSSLLLSLTM